mgnify:CR=1 FL=1
MSCIVGLFFFFQAEDGIRDLVRSRGLGDVYKRQPFILNNLYTLDFHNKSISPPSSITPRGCPPHIGTSTSGWGSNCLLYTSDAADERSSVDLGGRRIIKKKKKKEQETAPQ